MLPSCSSYSTWILVTSPIRTPRKFTGAPTRSPFTEPGKYVTQVRRSAKKRPLPNTSRPATTSAIAPTTKAPIRVGLACLLIAAPPSAHAVPAAPHDLPCPQIPSTLYTTVKIAIETTMNTMLVTTAEVVARPTAAELRPHCSPRRQPTMATTTP